MATVRSFSISSGAEDRRHAAARDQILDAIVIEQITGMKSSHVRGLS